MYLQSAYNSFLSFVKFFQILQVFPVIHCAKPRYLHLPTLLELFDASHKTKD